jgi:hypothetical protein
MKIKSKIKIIFIIKNFKMFYKFKHQKIQIKLVGEHLRIKMIFIA